MALLRNPNSGRLLLLCWCALAFFSAEPCQPAYAADAHTLELTSPASAADRTCLGIHAETFTLADVQGEIIIVELFSIYCSLCIREAPAFDELFQLARKHSTPQRKITVFGIGTGNSMEEVVRFRKQNSVPFPLIADQHADFARAMKMAITPACIAFKKQPDGSLVTLYVRPGILGPPQRFLDTVLRLASKRS